MCCLQKPTLKILGWIFSIVFILGAVILIILAGIHFRFTSQTYTYSPWGALGAVELASVIYIFVVGGLGILGFICESVCLLIVFVILLGMATIFILAISIFALVGGSIKYFDISVGCNSTYHGLLDAYASVDTYLIQADTYFCSKDCPCYVNATTASGFINNSTAVPFYNQWTKSDVATLPTNFTGCSNATKAKAINNYLLNNAYLNFTFDPVLFAQYWGNVETWFNCSGFCSTSYFNQETQTNSAMYKYVFSDIGRGVPEHIGCLNPILNWLPPTLNAFGSIGIISVCVMSFVVYLAICPICVPKDGSADEKPVKIHTETDRATEAHKEVKPSEGIELAKH